MDELSIVKSVVVYCNVFIVHVQFSHSCFYTTFCSCLKLCLLFYLIKVSLNGESF